jgi:hypothetical protein
MSGSRSHPRSGVYTRNELAIRLGVGVEQETTEPREAYAPFPAWQPGQPASFEGLPWG